MNDVIKVCIGTQDEQLLAAKVLEHSILSTTSSSVQFYRLGEVQRSYKLPQADSNKPRTPFSFQRFLIPEVVGFEGRAIYLDSDMQVFKPIDGLWRLDMNANELLGVKDIRGKAQYSVLLIDCVKAAWNIDDIVNSLDRGDFNYEQLMFDFALAKQQSLSIPWYWNSIELMGRDVSLLHYSDMNIQPWLSVRNPLADIWVEGLLNAIRDNYISIAEVEDAVEQGYVRPSLLFQVRNNTFSCRQLPETELNRDKTFIPPHMQSHAQFWRHRGGFKC